MKRIDSLTPGQTVTLGFWGSGGNRSYEEDAEFRGIVGSGEDRRAQFYMAPDASSDSSLGQRGYEWEAYRYNGMWAYGSSADRLSLLAIDGVPNVNPPKTARRHPAAATRSDSGVKYPGVRVRLVGLDGNAFAILGRVRQALRQRVGSAAAEEYTNEATQGSYDDLLATTLRYVTVS